MFNEEQSRPLQLDLLISILRWLLLVSVVIVALRVPGYELDAPDSRPLLALILIGAAYNLIITFLLGFRVFPRTVTWLALVMDSALAVGLMAASGGLQSPFVFFGLLPIVTAALHFSFVLSLVLALLITLGYLAVELVGPPELRTVEQLLPQIGNATILLLASLVTGYVGRRMQQRIEVAVEERQKEEKGRLQARHQQSRLIFELASTLSATLNYQRVLEAVLDVSEIGLHELTEKELSQVGIVLLFDNRRLRVAASRHLTRRDEHTIVKGERGVLAQALRTAELVLCDDPASDPELGRFVAMHRCKEAVAVPLRAGFENFGVVVFGSPTANVYTPDYHDLLVALCNQAVVALQNARLYQNLMEEKERIVAVEEDARKKLARDLHDGPTQSIAAIAMRLNYTQKLLENGRSDEVEEELTRIEDLARMTTKEIRHMLFTLRPLILETQGLRAALAQYITKRAETDSLPIHLDAPEGVDQVLEKDAQGVIFYIVEEAIGNARKHAQADNVWVRLQHRPGVFLAEIEDDGKGFDLDAVMDDYSTRGSLGMTNLHERTELVDGRLEIDTALGQGTRITLRVPVDR
jgi:signal transduction histidine kinase